MTPHNDTFAATVLDIAAQLEAADQQIKRVILKAAAAGDCATVHALVERWLSEPALGIVGDASSTDAAPCPPTFRHLARAAAGATS